MGKKRVPGFYGCSQYQWSRSQNCQLLYIVLEMKKKNAYLTTLMELTAAVLSL